ncbi:UNVERIFIED_CONTAM: putative 3-hydroxyisobutyrate dehydrogenase, mitochondrial, partial [Sesamum radiatum]
GCDTPAMLDAPVSGGVLSAETGSLSLMDANYFPAETSLELILWHIFQVGGSEEAYRSAKPLFLSNGQKHHILWWSRKWFGMPMLSAKICNNLAMCEHAWGFRSLCTRYCTFWYPEINFLILITMLPIVVDSDTYNPVPGVMDAVPASRNYEGGFATKLMAKDLKLAAIRQGSGGQNSNDICSREIQRGMQ